MLNSRLRCIILYSIVQRLRPDIFPEIAVLPGNDIEEKFKLEASRGRFQKSSGAPNGVPCVFEEPQEA